MSSGVVDKEAGTRSRTFRGDPDENPLNPRQEGGQTFSYPFSIAVVEIPSNWVGPIVDFDDAGKLTEKSLGNYTPICRICQLIQLRYSTEIEHHRRNQTTTRSTRRRKDRNRNYSQQVKSPTRQLM